MTLSDLHGNSPTADLFMWFFIQLCTQQIWQNFNWRGAVSLR